MIFILSILFFLLAITAYVHYKSIIAPAVIVPGIWGGMVFLYTILNHGMYNLSNNILGVLLLWVISFLMGCWLFSETNICNNCVNKHRKYKFNSTIRSIYYWITIIGSPFLLYIAYKQGSTMDGSFLFNLRMANTGIVQSDYQYGIFEYVFVFAFVSFLIEVFSYNKGDSNKKIVILLIINIALAIITMAKSSFFFIFLSLIITLIFKKQINKKQIICGFIIIIGLLSTVQLIRSDNEGDVLSDMFYVYILGGMPALDILINSDMHSLHFGQLCFKFFYTISSIITGITHQPEFSNTAVYDNWYVFVPQATNVFTVINPFWIDFSYWGVFIFGFIYGSFSGFIYRLARKKSLCAILIYSYVACTLILQFFGEYIFSNLSYTIQIILLTLIAYKSNFRLIWGKK